MLVFKKNLLVPIYSKLHSKSWDYLYLYTNFTCMTDATWIMRINWKATIIKLLTIYTHSLLTDIHWPKYHNNYLMQCLKVIYADGNRSLIHKRELSPWYITESCSRREGSYILVTRCTILHFGNIAKEVWQHVSHLVSWYLHCAVLSDVCCEM